MSDVDKISEASNVTADSGPKPAAPKPGVPSPAAVTSKSSAGHVHPHAAPTAPKSDPKKWGHVDDDGVVWVRTSAGDRQVGSWQAGNADEALNHFGRRFDDLATEVVLLEQRLETHPSDARKTRSAAKALVETVPEAKVVGDLEGLETRLHAIIEFSSQVEEQARKDKAAHRETAISRKEELASEAEQIGESSTQWKVAGDRLKAILDEWKTIRGIDRKTDDELWKRFSKAREAFNRRRGSHFAELDRNRATARNTKEELVVRAEKIAHNTDWNDTARAFRQLMDEWKAAGRAPREADNQLWARFKNAQDTFFDARHAAAAERDAEFEANAKAKEALLAEYDSKIDPAQGLDSAKRALRELQERWEVAGKVPRSRISEFEGRIRELEKRVDAEEQSQWRRNDPEVKARAGQFWDRVTSFEDQAAKAEAAGKKKDADKFRAQAEQWREWAQAAETAVEDR